MRFSVQSRCSGTRACFLAVALFLLSAPLVQAALSSAEHNALVDLYNSTNGASWINKTDWMVAADECTWYGIACDGGHTTVSWIGLSGNNLVGNLPGSLGNLTHLTQLTLNGNQLSGSIPIELGNLTSLVNLHLEVNQLSGSIPPELGNLTSLNQLYLSTNQLTGSIPTGLGNLTSLQELVLAGNHLSGSIPSQLGSLTGLRDLNVSNNQLNGSIPSQLGSLTGLQNLSLGFNQLSGSIPPELGNLTSLQWLGLSNNQLSGSIPSQLGSLTGLRDLYLNNNQLSGSIPTQLGNLTSLQSLNLNSNQLSGNIPTQLGSLTSLQSLHLEINQLSGSIPTQFGGLTGLQYLNLSVNQLSGSIPPELGNLTSLQWLSLFGNLLSGSVPSALTNLTSLPSGSAEIRWNALYSTDPALTSFLNAKQSGGDWQSTQTIAPANLSTSGATPSAITVNWTPIAYTADGGFYQVGYSTTAGGPYAPFPPTTSSKSSSSLTVTGLAANTRYYFVVSTTTQPHGGNSNIVTSGFSAEVSDLTAGQPLPPVVNAFTANPSTITAGQSSTLSWTTTNATTVSISGVTGTQPATGSVPVSPAATTTYTLTATGPGGTATATTAIVVNPAAPVIVSFAASPSTITAGQSSTLSWTTTNATTVSIDNGVGAQPVNGSVSLSPAGTTTYVLTATNAAGSSTTGSATVTVTTPGKLQILLPGETAAPFTASGKTGSPRLQIAGTAFNVVVNVVDVNWIVVNTATDTVAITSTDPAAALPPSGALTAGSRTFAVTLNTSGSQTLLATDLSNPTTAAATGGPVVVLPRDAPVIAVASLPVGMVSSPNTGGAVDSYTLVNTGGSTTTIAVTQTGNFFSQAPTSFTLGPGQSQQITITAAAQPAGSYTGTSIPSGNGVAPGLSIPIKLLVAAAPAGSPHVVPTVVRIDTSELVTTGSATFHNDGTASATGIFVTDVPWLIPQSAPLTIAAGGSETGAFTIDRSQRPDADGLLGAQTARFTFVYVSGSGASQGSPATVLGSTPPTGNAIVTLVDTIGVNRGTSQGIPPLGSGQVARFVAGLPHKLGNIADVSFVNAGASALPASVIYFVPSGLSSSFAQIASVSQLSSNAPVGLGDVVSTVFRNDAITGSLQFRSSTSDLLAVQAMLSNGTSQGRLGTALSVFRSDLVAAAGQDFYLAGVRKDSTIHTDLYIQEAAGFPASIQLDFFDAGGAPVAPGRAPDPVPDFGQLELLDVVPAGAVVARITNNPGSTGKVVVEAHVVENGGDVWNIVDSSRQAGFTRSEPIVIPFAASVRTGTGTYTATDLVITNTSAVTATGTLALPSGVSRRRAVRTSAQGAPAAGVQPLGSTLQNFSFAPHQTRILTDVLRTSAGLPKDGRTYITFTPTSGEFVVTSRTYVSVPGQSWTVGSSVPGIAIASAMKAGESRHMAGLEDASPKTVAAAVPGTFRTSVGFIETVGKDVTVRLTVRYIYASQATTQHPPPVSADFVLKANQLLMIDDLVRSIIGSQRDQYGDLHNIQLDVEVASGGGAAIPFVLSTDNGSGDISFIPIL